MIGLKDDSIYEVRRYIVTNWNPVEITGKLSKADWIENLRVIMCLSIPLK